MQLGMIGLGRMGGNMVRRLMAKGHEVPVYSATAKTRENFAKETGAFAASSIEELIAKLKTPRVVWVMVPAAATDETLAQVVSRLPKKGTSSLTAGIPTTSMTSVGPKSWLPRGSTTSIAEPAEASGAWSEATA